MSRMTVRIIGQKWFGVVNVQNKRIGGATRTFFSLYFCCFIIFHSLCTACQLFLFVVVLLVVINNDAVQPKLL